MIRHNDTLLEGTIQRTMFATAKYMGDLFGTWFHVIWADGFECWIHHKSVTVI